MNNNSRIRNIAETTDDTDDDDCAHRNTILKLDSMKDGNIRYWFKIKYPEGNIDLEAGHGLR